MTSTAFDDQFAPEPAEHIADASTMMPATSMDSVTSAIMGAFRMLVAAGNRLASEYEEFEGPDGLAVGVGLDYWHEFAEALERAREALATLTPNRAQQATPSDADLFNLVRDLNDHDIKMLPLMAASRLVRAAINRFCQPAASAEPVAWANQGSLDALRMHREQHNFPAGAMVMAVPVSNNTIPLYTAPAATLAQPTPLLTADHQGMRVDYAGLLKQARGALTRGIKEPALAEMLRQLQEHLQELGTRWYAGDTTVVDEILQLYCVRVDARGALKGKCDADK